MKSTINYLVLTAVFAAEIILILSGELLPTLCGILSTICLVLLSRTKLGRMMWRNYLKSTIKIERYFGVY